jgi:Tfp pilus assembly protein PilV
MIMEPDKLKERRSELGVSIVEVVVALVVLTVGALGMAGTTLHVVREVAVGNVMSERAAATQSVVERVRALPFDSVAAGSQTAGSFVVTWTIPESDLRTKLVRFVSVGPGLVTRSTGPALVRDAADTLAFRLYRP